jgi:hypothetical protein
VGLQDPPFRAAFQCTLIVDTRCLEDLSSLITTSRLYSSRRVPKTAIYPSIQGRQTSACFTNRWEDPSLRIYLQRTPSRSSATIQLYQEPSSPQQTTQPEAPLDVTLESWLPKSTSTWIPNIDAIDAIVTLVASPRNLPPFQFPHPENPTLVASVLERRQSNGMKLPGQDPSSTSIWYWNPGNLP